ncbi:LRR receptor kinase SERK2-like [Magnolia sinica]|uniref:LRR receptor kinase SERK2-like n=1 Tax=Magnolia sinica TaxID=86752 RepID=UPI00265A1713|nr:LRR receptor kinase SERK2-like [Magnolia sinica]
MRCVRSSLSPLLLLAAGAALLLSAIISTVNSTTCPYDIPSSTALIPPACYGNYTPAAAAAAPPTNCCWFVFAAYIFAAIRHSNATGDAFLPDPTASSCSDAFAAYLLRHGLVRPQFLLSAGRCNLNGDDPSQFAAGKRACQYYTVADIRSTVNLSTVIKLCTSGLREPTFDQASCNACKRSVIAATLSLLQITKSKEFVPCGMATTIGIWASLPEIGRFRSYALCMVQVLDDIGSLGTSNLIPSPPLPPSSPPRVENPKKPRAAIKIAVSSAAAGLLSVAAVLVLLLAIRKRRRSTLVSFSVEDPTATIESPLPTDGLYIFTRSELKQATNDFDPQLLLGEGGAGKVYLGKLPSGQRVAIKRIQLEKKLGEFYREIEILVKLRHRNLTTLVGYCLHKKEHVLVYEYMAGGNLSHALYHGELTWHRRVQIAVDIAEGLAYLHEFPGGAVIHRDVKPTNVLLNDLGQAKLSDFGVSKILPSEISHVSTMEIRGTRGYMDPECFSMGHVSEATDVYSFGIVLLELITGSKAVVPTPSGGAESIVYIAHELMGSGTEPDVRKIMDRQLGPVLDPGSVEEVFKVAYRCVKPYKNERPKMKEVLEVLKRVLADLEGVGSTEVEAVGPTGNEVVSREVSLASTSEITPPSVDAWSL